MSRVIELAGFRFGRLSVLERAPGDGGQAIWIGVCDCGNRVRVRSQDLRSGHTKSCGCLHLEVTAAIAGKHNSTHGLTRSPIYAIWRGMMSRCYSERSKWFKRYGQRGVKVCPQWHDFRTFYEEFGRHRPDPNHSIDRIDNDGDYEPGNCRWALPIVQQNNRSSNVLVTHDGATKTISQWARLTGLSQSCLSTRIKRGWPIHMALALAPDTTRQVMPRRNQINPN